MTGYLFYLAALTGLIVSLVADRRKTAAALKKALQTVVGILPELVGILVLIGIALAFLDAPTISRLIGADSGWWGDVASDSDLLRHGTSSHSFFRLPWQPPSGSSWSAERECAAKGKQSYTTGRPTSCSGLHRVRIACGGVGVHP